MLTHIIFFKKKKKTLEVMDYYQPPYTDRNMLCDPTR